jgi:hypothetical protein
MEAGHGKMMARAILAVFAYGHVEGFKKRG